WSPPSISSTWRATRRPEAAERPPQSPAHPLPRGATAMLCRVLPHLSSGGPENMALDEAMLDAVAEEPSRAFVRTYGWREPTLSLGYFQAIAAAESDPRWQGVPVVRRPTGGGAIWHHHELTYALVVSTRHPLARPSSALYHGVHAVIARLLQAHG